MLMIQLHFQKNVRNWIISYFVVFATFIAVYLSVTLYYYPLTHGATNGLAWLRNWLIMTVINYYGAAACLVTIALLNEPIIQGIFWSLGFCLLGSPVCCVYIVYRATFKSLRFFPTPTSSRIVSDPYE
jgi:hypothetical protein